MSAPRLPSVTMLSVVITAAAIFGPEVAAEVDLQPWASFELLPSFRPCTTLILHSVASPPLASHTSLLASFQHF